MSVSDTTKLTPLHNAVAITKYLSIIVLRHFKYRCITVWYFFWYCAPLCCCTYMRRRGKRKGSWSIRAGSKPVLGPIQYRQSWPIDPTTSGFVCVAWRQLILQQVRDMLAGGRARCAHVASTLNMYDVFSFWFVFLCKNAFVFLFSTAVCFVFLCCDWA